MANLARSAVTTIETWKEGGTNARKFLAKRVTLVLTGQGGATNLIPASVFGMSKIWSARDAITDGGTLLIACPSYDQANLLLFGLESDAPVDITDTIRLTVAGKE